MFRPLAIDLFCGLGGWAEGLLAEGWDVIGFDLERHRYPARVMPEGGARKVRANGVDFNNKGPSERRSFNYANEVSVRNAPLTGGWVEYPGTLVLQDVLTLDGAQFRGADLIVASPPCQAYSYRAMPWKRAKALPPPDNTLFDACFRIQAEASAAAGRRIPLIVENVRGAQKWVGRARWNFGSFYLWGDVPALMPIVAGRKCATKGVLHRPAGHWTNPAEHGTETAGGTDRWFNDGPRTPDSLASSSSASPRRKAASAIIAKIPLALARHIGRVFHPSDRPVRPEHPIPPRENEPTVAAE